MEDGVCVEVCMCDGGSDGSVHDIPISHNGIAGGRIGWGRCGSGKRGPIVDSRMGGVLGVVVGAAMIGDMRRTRGNL